MVEGAQEVEVWVHRVLDLLWVEAMMIQGLRMGARQAIMTSGHNKAFLCKVPMAGLSECLVASLKAFFGSICNVAEARHLSMVTDQSLSRCQKHRQVFRTAVSVHQFSAPRVYLYINCVNSVMSP